MRARKRPVEVEYIQFTGDNKFEVMEWAIQQNGAKGAELDYSSEKLKIHTLEGTMTASKGDFIIKGVKGEFYPCKPDIFAETYEVLT